MKKTTLWAVMLISTASSAATFETITIDEQKYKKIVDEINETPTKFGAPVLRFLEILELDAIQTKIKDMKSSKKGMRPSMIPGLQHLPKTGAIKVAPTSPETDKAKPTTNVPKAWKKSSQQYGQ